MITVRCIGVMLLALLLLGPDKASESSWQLPDDSDWTVTLDPWPCKQGGNVTIHGVATTDDNDEKFKGNVEYRIVTDHKATGPWLPMKPVKAKDKSEAEFEAMAKLPAVPKVWFHFRLKQDSEPKAVEFTDCEIELEK